MGWMEVINIIATNKRSLGAFRRGESFMLRHKLKFSANKRLLILRFPIHFYGVRFGKSLNVSERKIIINKSANNEREEETNFWGISFCQPSFLALNENFHINDGEFHLLHEILFRIQARFKSLPIIISVTAELFCLLADLKGFLLCVTREERFFFNISFVLWSILCTNPTNCSIFPSFQPRHLNN